MSTIRSIAPIRLRLVVLLMPLCIPGSLSAADPQPFSSLQVQLQTAVDVSRNRLHRYWQPATGVGLVVSTPFYFGAVEVAIRTLYYRSTAQNVPGFQSMFGFLGWSSGLDLPADWRLVGGLGIGDNHLYFGRDVVNPLEGELCTRTMVRLERPIGERYLFTLTASREIVFTYRRIKLTFIAAGIGGRIAAPGWFQEFLR